MSTWDQAFAQLQQRVANLIESIEGQNQAGLFPVNVEPEPTPDPDPITQADATLQKDRDAERRELSLQVERIKPQPEPPPNLSGIVASLPEITAAQREAVTRIDHRLNLLKVRSDATADALASVVREIEYLRRRVDDLGKAVTSCHQTESELAANQRQLAESLNLLHDLVARATQTVKSNAAWIEMLAETPDARYQGLRDHLTAQSARVETKGNLTLLASALAVLAALVAIVLSIAR
jgi:chromosome segregation ATPase